MKKNKVLLMGSGGREHALAWKMAQSPLLDQLYTAPGNPGTAQCGENVSLDIMDNEAIIDFCIGEGIDLVVVGPEAPLVNGVRDAFTANSQSAHITVIGPGKAGAELEGSKDFSKVFMAKHGIPTAAYKTFDKGSLEDGLAFLETLSKPFVLKCDGLAAGKGVLILDDLGEAKASLREILEGGSFGDAGAKVVIEEFLDGTELSCFILTDGSDYLLLPTAKDYKRIGEGDTGLNTGGMGALSPAPVADAAFMDKVKERVIERTLKGLQADGIAYHGFLFIGLMRVDDEPYVIEYNVRMGDPETEAVMPRITSDLLSHFVALGDGQLGTESLEISDEAACTVMMVSKGYPEAYEKGKTLSIDGSDSEHQILFHAGIKEAEGALKTAGGRVITSTGMATQLAEALDRAYQGVNRVSFEGKTYRKDIGYELKGS